MMSNARQVPSSIARVLEELELRQPRIVTRDMLATIVADADLDKPVPYVARLLREHGWLLSLRTSGTWEFAPGARAGAIGAGDPLIELRAHIESGREPFDVAGLSAVWLHGWANHAPVPAVIAAAPEREMPKSLRDLRVVRWARRSDTVDITGLPVWRASTLVAFMAAKPGRFGDWANASAWLDRACEQASPDTIAHELDGFPRSAWARAAYLLDVGARERDAMRLLHQAPPGKGPYHLGNRDRPNGRYSQRFDVVDHVLTSG